MLLKNIPGLEKKVAAAARLEAELRELPFLGVNLDICGIEVKQFAPRHFLYLDTARIPFMTPAALMADQAAMFLWVISPGFNPAGAGRKEFLGRIASLNFGHLKTELTQYVEQAMMDAPKGQGDGRAASTSFYAYVIDALVAGGYQWPRDVIMDTPFAEIFQYLRRIASRKGDAALANPLSDKARREAVNAYAARKAAARKRRAEKRQKGAK